MVTRNLQQTDPTPLCAALRTLIGWETTSTELWEHLEHIGVEGNPRSPSSLSYTLRVAAPYLLAYGIDVKFDRQRGRATIILIDGVPSVKHGWGVTARAKA